MLAIGSPLLPAGEPTPHSPPVNEVNPRFIKLNGHGDPRLNPQNSFAQTPWSCILDRQTGLVWESKQRRGLQDFRSTYTWFQPDKSDNGGFAGYANGGQCTASKCDTNAFISALNQAKLCGLRTWRLPTREELRSLVDYSAEFPGPSINRQFFPNTQRQFYWSSTADASDPDSAWGIGFTFGYDYSYFKRDFGHIRLVSHSSK